MTLYERFLGVSLLSNAAGKDKQKWDNFNVHNSGNAPAIFSIRFKLLATIFQHSISIGGAPRSKISSCHFEISVKMLLTYFTSMFYFHTPWTRHETIDFWRFQGVYKWNISMKLVKCSMKCPAKKVMMSSLFL